VRSIDISNTLRSVTLLSFKAGRTALYRYRSHFINVSCRIPATDLHRGEAIPKVQAVPNTPQYRQLCSSLYWV